MMTPRRRLRDADEPDSQDRSGRGLRAAQVSAEAHRRSLNSEVIVCLEAILMPGRISTSERLEQARRLRDSLRDFSGRKPTFRPKDIEAFKREGRA